jgi:general secretion pathway protein A
MSDGLLQHFGLLARPFEIVTDARFFFASREHEEALARLLYLVDQESMYFGMLTGEIGAGKSITRKVLTERMDRRRHYVVEFENSGFSFGDLILRLFVKAGYEVGDVPSASDYGGLFDALADFACALQREQGRQLVLLFDEAQDLDKETLESLKRLSNLNGEMECRITMVFIGQPELRSQIAKLPPMDQRISLRFHLPNLSQDELAAYLSHRLRVAGHPSGELFDEATIALLYDSSNGVPRELNRLAKLALDAAAAAKKPSVGAQEVAAVIGDLQRHQSLPWGRGLPK